MLTFADLKTMSDVRAVAKNGILTIDPGLKNTGWALWHDLQKPPRAAERPAFSGVHKVLAPSWTHALDSQTTWLNNLLVQRRFGLVVIEWVEMWGTIRSEATAKKGTLFQLAALIGAMFYVAWDVTHSEPVLVLAREWKGQLKNPALKRRVKRALGKTYRDHEADAVGIGLALQGAL